MINKTLKKLFWLILSVISIALIVVIYMVNKPHRNVQAADVFAEIKINDLLNEFSIDPSKANTKYLSDDGNSKVLVVEGPVYSVSTNQKNEKVILLKDANSKVGVSCTFTEHSNPKESDLSIGSVVKIKGAITAGNSYDADLDLYNHAILVQCDLIK